MVRYKIINYRYTILNISEHSISENLLFHASLTRNHISVSQEIKFAVLTICVFVFNVIFSVSNGKRARPNKFVQVSGGSHTERICTCGGDEEVLKVFNETLQKTCSRVFHINF